MAISSRWFTFHRPELRELIKDRLQVLGTRGFEIVSDFDVTQGLYKDPFVGTRTKNFGVPWATSETHLEEGRVIAAVGCRDSRRASDATNDAYVGLRTWPAFGGRGSKASERGTLVAGTAWAAERHEDLVAIHAAFRDWEPAHQQWIIWKPILCSSESDDYLRELANQTVELFASLTRDV